MALLTEGPAFIHCMILPSRVNEGRVTGKIIITRVLRNTAHAHNILTCAIISLTENSLCNCIFCNTCQLARLH